MDMITKVLSTLIGQKIVATRADDTKIEFKTDSGVTYTFTAHYDKYYENLYVTVEYDGNRPWITERSE